jgi:hypothetical protein
VLVPPAHGTIDQTWGQFYGDANACDPSRDRAMVSSTNQDVAFVAVARRGGWTTEVEVPRHGCTNDAMAALLERFANPATIH